MPRHVSLIVGAAAGIIASAVAASAAVVVLGHSKAHDCYLAAKTGVDMRAGIALCSAAMDEGEISGRDRAATYVNRGVLYDAIGQYSDAFDDFNTSILRDPSLGDGYLNRGVALIRMKRYPEAFTDIQKAIAMGVTTPQIGYYDLAVAEEYLGRVTEAYYDYKRALAADPDYAPATEALTHFTVTRRPAHPSDSPSDGT